MSGITYNTDADCIFCKIVAGEIPSSRVYEDDSVVAFKDINPQAKVHVLIVPRNHYKNVAELASKAPETLAHIAGVAQKLLMMNSTVIIDSYLILVLMLVKQCFMFMLMY